MPIFYLHKFAFLFCILSENGIVFPVIGGAAPPGSHPVPAHRFLARNGVWYWDRAAEEDTGLHFDVTPQFSAVFPAVKRVLASGGELQQGELKSMSPRCQILFGYILW